MYVVDRTVEGQNIVSVPLRSVSNTLFQRRLDAIQDGVPILRTPDEVIVDDVYGVVRASDTHTNNTHPTLLPDCSRNIFVPKKRTEYRPKYGTTTPHQPFRRRPTTGEGICLRKRVTDASRLRRTDSDGAWGRRWVSTGQVGERANGSVLRWTIGHVKTVVRKRDRSTMRNMHPKERQHVQTFSSRSVRLATAGDTGSQPYPA